MFNARVWLLLGLLSINLLGCANIHSISRRTEIPKVSGPKDDPRGSEGIAIHLDPQQRLVIFDRFQRYCAEPSPDALAAYASATALSGSHPSKITAALSEATQSSAASIGLRTQSITLMRDALYRMCEAYSNGAIESVQIATLLGRSQDLTAVILAVEQLTGAVVANQAILTGTSSASASSNTTASATGAGQFSTPVQQKELSKDATESVATAVKEMVIKVLEKQYSLESCMALLTSSATNYDKLDLHQRNGYDLVRQMCVDLIGATLTKEIKQAAPERYMPDEASDIILKALEKDRKLIPILDAWLEKNNLNIKEEKDKFLAGGGKYTYLRQKFIEEVLNKSKKS